MIIGLHGKKHAGKDTALGYIDEYFRSTALKVEGRSFAKALKESAAEALGYTNAPPEDVIAFCNEMKENGTIIVKLSPQIEWELSGREYLQRYGTEAHRDVFGNDFWVDVAAPLDLVSHDNKLLVYTDVRFPNEADRLKELGGTIWHIIRPDVEEGDSHASEQPLPPQLIDAVVWNDKDLDHFRKEVTIALTRDLNSRLSVPVVH